MRPRVANIVYRNYNARSTEHLLIRAVRDARDRAGLYWRPCSKSPMGRHAFVQTEKGIFCAAPGCGFGESEPA